MAVLAGTLGVLWGLCLDTSVRGGGAEGGWSPDPPSGPWQCLLALVHGPPITGVQGHI